MAGHVKLGNHPDAACPRIGDHFAQLILGVVFALGCDLGQLGKFLAFGAESLIVAEMPVKDIEFRGGHAIERSFHRAHRLKMAAHIEHEAAPAKTRHIVDGHGGQHASTVLHGRQLQKGLKSVHRSQVGGRSQRGSLARNAGVDSSRLRRWSAPPHRGPATLMSSEACAGEG